MAMKRCPDCGEKYSDSYKYCPFCEEEEILKEGKGRGVRRAKQSRSFSLLTPVLIILILVMAGLLMFLLRSDKQPTEPVTPQPGVETPVEPGTDTEPGSTDSDGTDSTDPGTMPDEPDSNTPSTPTTPDTSSDTSAAGSEATIVNAATGVNVRPDASTNGAAIASLKNGDKVQVVRDAGNGWYEITFSDHNHHIRRQPENRQRQSEQRGGRRECPSRPQRQRHASGLSEQRRRGSDRQERGRRVV